ncbi:MAG: hypothetical protein ACTSSF_04620 [Candidatus Heimdallarchaeaceae archaeon]
MNDLQVRKKKILPEQEGDSNSNLLGLVVCSYFNELGVLADRRCLLPD